MNIARSKRFKKEYRMLSREQKKLVNDTIIAFMYGEEVNDHPLRDEYKNKRSIQADDDLLLHYLSSKKKITFVRVGTHRELYG